MGGNTDGSDGRVLLSKFNSSIVIFEPVPAFFQQLNKTWQGLRESQGYRAELLNVGLGGSSRYVVVVVDIMVVTVVMRLVVMMVIVVGRCGGNDGGGEGVLKMAI